MPGPPAWAGVPGHSSRGARHAACWLTYTGPFASPVQDRKPNGKAPCGPGLASRILSRCDVQSFWCLSSPYFVLFLSRSWGQRIRMDGVSSQRLMSQSCAGSASENMICYISLSSWTLIGLCSGWMDSVYCCLCVCVRERRGEMERERRRDGIVETDGERERERERRGEKVLTILAVWGWFTSFSAELFVETKSGRRHRELLLGFRILANHRLDVRIWAWPPSTGTIAVNIFHPSQTSTVSLYLR